MSATQQLRRKDLIEPELSYKIIGILFDVYNVLGPGYSEAYYQKAIAIALRDASVDFQKEILLPVEFHGKLLGRQRCDFLVADKILLEIKKGNEFSRHNIEQVLNYLRASGLQLAILVNFSHKGILFKRIVNTDSYISKDS
jgi:GxxExxY protein